MHRSRPVGLPFAGRSPVFAQGGMAATSQPLSTQAALDILKMGGSAVDAAIAANAMVSGAQDTHACMNHTHTHFAASAALVTLY